MQETLAARLFRQRKGSEVAATVLGAVEPIATQPAVLHIHKIEGASVSAGVCVEAGRDADVPGRAAIVSDVEDKRAATGYQRRWHDRVETVVEGEKRFWAAVERVWQRERQLLRLPGEAAIVGAVDAERVAAPVSVEDRSVANDPTTGGAGKDEGAADTHWQAARAGVLTITGAGDERPGEAAVLCAKNVEGGDSVCLIAHDPRNRQPAKLSCEEEDAPYFIAPRVQLRLLPVLAAIAGAPDREGMQRRVGARKEREPGPGVLAIKEIVDGSGGSVCVKVGSDILPVLGASCGMQDAQRPPTRPAAGGVDHLQAEERNRSRGLRSWRRRRQPCMVGGCVGRGPRATSS
ncbi:MAG TPA: hypothetical protein VFZ02_13720 [Ktedonobacteraceae bacterium]